MNKIYVSTGAFKTKNLETVLDIAYRYGINYLELSSGLEYRSDTIDLVKNSLNNNFKFLIHNYFPAPKDSFVLNLASSDRNAVEKSLNLCRRAIDLTKELGGDIYSIHSGFAFDGNGRELGNESILNLHSISIEDAFEIFIENIQVIAEYAKNRGIKIAIENNVFPEYAAKNNADLSLGVTTEDMTKILTHADNDNLYVLLDLAHAKVSNTFKKFGLHQMVSSLSDKIAIVHISDNDGRLDQNLKLKKESDLIPLLRRLRDKIIVLESYHLEPEEIKEQIYLIEEVINHGGCEPCL